MENKPINYKEQLMCVKLSQAELFSLGCSREMKPKTLLFGRRLKRFWVKTLTSICHLDPVHEKVTLLSLTRSPVALVFSL